MVASVDPQCRGPPIGCRSPRKRGPLFHAETHTNVAEPPDTTSQIAATQSSADSAPVQEATPAPVPPTQSETAASTLADSPSTQATLSPEVAQSIEPMAREIASLEQTVEQLQAGQQQLISDVAKMAEHEKPRKQVSQKSKPGAASRPQHVSAPAAARRVLSPPSQA